LLTLGNGNTEYQGGANTCISQQLAFGLRILVAVTAFAAIISALVFFYIYVKQIRSFERQSAAVAIADAISVKSASLKTIMLDLDKVDTLAALEDLEKEAKHVYRHIAENTQALRHTEQSDEQAIELKVLIQTANEDLFSRFSDYRELFALKRAFNDQLAAARSLDESIKLHLEKLNADRAYSLYSTSKIEQAVTNTNQIFIAYEDSVRISEMNALRQSMYNALGKLDTSHSKTDIDKITNSYQLSVRNFTGIAVEFNKSRESLLNFSRRLFSSFTNSNNVFKTKQTLAAKELELTTKNQDLSLKINNIEANASLFRERAISQSYTQSSKLVRSTSFAFAIVLITLIVTFVTYAYVIRRKIYDSLISPILEITKITKQYSESDFSKPLKKYKSQELVDMTNALNIFKATAIELEKANDDLRSANRDIENFAYAASHDLKSPLRGIANLVSFVRQDMEGQLTGETENHLDLINKRIHRLDNLMDDLLAYAKLSKIERTFSKVDARVFIEEIFHIVNTNNQFSLELNRDTQYLHTITTPLSRVIQNLIDNAIKHHDRKSGTISIDILSKEKHYQITLKDDGPGIPEKFHEKIFSLFQTLKPKDKVEGSGMGLAMVARILEDFSCEIHVISAPEKERGTSFIFEWPKMTANSGQN